MDHNKSTSKPDGDIIMLKNGLKNHTKSKYLNECYCLIDMLPNYIALLYYVLLYTTSKIVYGDSN